MPDPKLAIDLILILLVAFVGGVVASTLKQPLVIGYLLGGLILGPHALKLISSSEEISTLAEIGVAFLMFTLGVEFNLRNLSGLGKIAVVGTAVQVISSVVFALPLMYFLDWSFFQAFFFGCLLSLSSTAIVIKILTDKSKLDTVTGNIASAWLLAQDLAVLPLIILLPVFGGKEGGWLGLGWGIIKSALILGLTFYLGGKIIPYILGRVASYGREVLLLSIVLFTLGVALLTLQFGLSFAMGAFLAGLIVSETEMSEEALAQVKSLRDLFLIVFFVSVGMLLDIGFVLTNLGVIALVLVLLYLGKFLPIFSWIFSFGYHAKVSFVAAIYLLQVGEFSFVLGKIGLKERLISEYQYNLILSVALVSILITPFLIKYDNQLYQWFQKIIKLVPLLNQKVFTNRSQAAERETEAFKEHVVLLGFGRVGKYISHALKHVEIPHVVIEVDPQALRIAKERGIKAFYGDGSEQEVLEKAGIKEARAMVISHPDQTSAVLSIQRAKRLNQGLKILARAHRDLDVESLKDLDLVKVVQPEFEASVSLMHKLLDTLGVAEETVKSFTDHIRRQSLGK